MANKRITWSKDDDLKLAESVLNALRHGNSALSGIKAFVEADGKRTFEACKFRWFTTLRAKYDEAIKLAKPTPPTAPKQATNTAVADALIQLQNAVEAVETESTEWKAKYEALQLEYEMLAEEYMKLKNAVKVIQEAQTHAWKIDKNGVVAPAH